MFSCHKNLISQTLKLATTLVLTAGVAQVANAASETTNNPDKIGQFGFGGKATAEEIAGWDIDVRPDGLGLPPGEGSVEDGEFLYDAQCSSCHGLFGEGAARWPKLAGGEGSLTWERPDKTVGSYWPYASTLWDYIHRAMPFPAPESLTDDEVYAISAYVLYLNGIVDEDFVLTQDNLADIEMPNAGNFYRDDRPDIRNKRCMKNCKDPDSIEVTYSLTGVTPTDHFRGDGNDGVAYEEEEAVSEGSVELSASAAAGQETYETACKVCHGAGLAGAPRPGIKEDWTGRLDQDISVIYDHAINGFQGSKGVMPPKGGQMQLSDEAVKQAVDFMVESSR